VKPLFRKFQSNFFAALESLRMCLCFGLDKFDLQKKYKMKQLLPKGPQDRTSTDDQRHERKHVYESINQKDYNMSECVWMCKDV
jgi:hypothetical protein